MYFSIQIKLNPIPICLYLVITWCNLCLETSNCTCICHDMSKLILVRRKLTVRKVDTHISSSMLLLTIDISRFCVFLLTEKCDSIVACSLHILVKFCYWFSYLARGKHVMSLAARNKICNYCCSMNSI